MASMESTATAVDGEPSGTTPHGITITLPDTYIEAMESLNEELAYWEREADFEQTSVRHAGGAFDESRWQNAVKRVSALQKQRQSLLARPVIVAMWERTGELRRQEFAVKE